MTRASVRAPTLQLLNGLLHKLFACEVCVCDFFFFFLFSVHSVIGAKRQCMAVISHNEIILLRSQNAVILTTAPSKGKKMN